MPTVGIKGHEGFLPKGANKGCNQGFAEEVKEFHGNKIMDNSFLFEEAYNQEPGVIRHIQTFRYLEKSKNREYSFTQEWPVPGQRHPLSYTIPISYLNNPLKKNLQGKSHEPRARRSV